MDIFIAFLSATALTLVVGAIAPFVISLFTRAENPRVTGFYVAVGFALGQFSYAGPFTANAATALAALLGSVVALVALGLTMKHQLPGSTNDSE